MNFIHDNRDRHERHERHNFYFWDNEYYWHNDYDRFRYKDDDIRYEHDKLIHNSDCYRKTWR